MRQQALDFLKTGVCREESLERTNKIRLNIRHIIILVAVSSGVQDFISL